MGLRGDAGPASSVHWDCNNILWAQVQHYIIRWESCASQGRIFFFCLISYSLWSDQEIRVVQWLDSDKRPPHPLFWWRRRDVRQQFNKKVNTHYILETISNKLIVVVKLLGSVRVTCYTVLYYQSNPHWLLVTVWASVSNGQWSLVVCSASSLLDLDSLETLVAQFCNPNPDTHNSSSPPLFCSGYQQLLTMCILIGPELTTLIPINWLVVVCQWDANCLLHCRSTKNG